MTSWPLVIKRVTASSVPRAQTLHRQSGNRAANQEESHVRLALTAADNSTLCPVQQADAICHWAQNRVLWKEAFVIVENC